MNDEEKAYIEWLANQDELRHNSDKRLEQAERELERLRAENAELRARLDAQGQHPGFPQPDPDEPVAGTA